MFAFLLQVRVSWDSHQLTFGGGPPGSFAVCQCIPWLTKSSQNCIPHVAPTCPSSSTSRQEVTLYKVSSPLWKKKKSKETKARIPSQVASPRTPKATLFQSRALCSPSWLQDFVLLHLVGYIGIKWYQREFSPKIFFHVDAAVIRTVRRFADTHWASSGTCKSFPARKTYRSQSQAELASRSNLEAGRNCLQANKVVPNLDSQARIFRLQSFSNISHKQKRNVQRA